MLPPIPAGKKQPALTFIPNEIIFEILTRLPGKQVAWCKIVCKTWLSMIRCVSFRKAYRCRHRGLILHWGDKLEPEVSWRCGIYPDRRIRFYYSPLLRLNEPPEDFSPFLQFDLCSSYDGATQVVNGLVIYGQEVSKMETELTIYSVFTGEKMKVPDPEAVFGGLLELTESIFHLGFDPVSGEYKIMRLIFQCDWEGTMSNLPLRLQTIVLRPSESYSDSESAWTWIRYEDTGLADLHLRSKVVYKLLTGVEARMFSGDGVVCWFRRKKEGLILFDFHEERFRRVKLPEGLEPLEMDEKRMFVRCSFNGLSQSLALYVLPLDGSPKCFVLDDYKDGIWRKEYVVFPEDIRVMGDGRGLVVAAGDEMLMLMGNENSNSRVVYSYGDDKSVERFLVGNIPHNNPLDWSGTCKPWDCYSNFAARLSCLHDSSVLYRSISDVLSCSNVCECCGNKYENKDSVSAR